MLFSCLQDDEEVTPGYKTPKKVDLKTIQDLDQDDEALVKYKEQLLGKKEDVLGMNVYSRINSQYPMNMLCFKRCDNTCESGFI